MDGYRLGMKMQCPSLKQKMLYAYRIDMSIY